jgi:hypothetical protein
MRTKRNKYWVNYAELRAMNPCSEFHRFVTACGGMTACKRLGYFHLGFIINKVGIEDFQWVCNSLGITYGERQFILELWTKSLQDYAVLRARIRYVEEMLASQE